MLMEITRMTLTENEINNLIYTLIKFGFRKICEELRNPPNILIKEIMIEVLDDPTVDNIIDKTMVVVMTKYNITLSDKDLLGLKGHMELISNLFMAEPYELRADLGLDRDAEEFVTKH